MSFVISAVALPCSSGKSDLKMSPKKVKAFKIAPPTESPQRFPASTRRVPPLPSEQEINGMPPWGGKDALQWSPEAVLANAASEALNRVWVLPETEDAIVAVPMKILRSDLHPYGDGQSNSAVALPPTWTEPRPPLVATLVKEIVSAKTNFKTMFRFDKSLNFGDKGFVNILFRPQGSDNPTMAQVAAKKTSEGFVEVEWDVPSGLDWENLVQQDFIYIKPLTWNDWFVVSFRHPIVTIPQLIQSIPAELRKGRAPKTFLDPEDVSNQNHPVSTPFTKLMEKAKEKKFLPGFNQEPFDVINIHGEFPLPNGKTRVTGVAHGWTWVWEKPQAPFKILYTCFERRNFKSEISVAGPNVPTAGGWHEVGDNAETIINSLETVPIAVGHGISSVAAATPTGTFAYGLTDSITVRWLHPGEALVTTRGDSDWGYLPKASPSIKANFHWFFFDAPREVCTVEWVHPCLPDNRNNLGLKCSGN